MASAITPISAYFLSTFSYENPTTENTWPYGIIYVLWHLDSSTPVWSLDWGGDFQPHSIAWIDFNGDEKLDLFCLAGFEDVSETYVYLWNFDRPVFHKEALLNVYSNYNDYSVLLDIEGDGRPEILSSGHSGDNRIEQQCGENKWDEPKVPDSVYKALKREYSKLSQDFDQFNYTGNMPESYPAWSMKILDPIKILRIEGSRSVDVTEQYPHHLRWRLEMLQTIRTANSGKCREFVDVVISYIKGRIE
jgi:hypothetical protein